TNQIEALRHDHPFSHRLINSRSFISFNRKIVIAVCISPVRIDQDARQYDIQPIQPDRQLKMNMLTQESGGKREKCYDSQEKYRAPVKIAIILFDIIQLDPLPRPEYPHGHKGQEVDQEFRK